MLAEAARLKSPSRPNCPERFAASPPPALAPQPAPSGDPREAEAGPDAREGGVDVGESLCAQDVKARFDRALGARITSAP